MSVAEVITVGMQDQGDEYQQYLNVLRTQLSLFGYELKYITPIKKNIEGLKASVAKAMERSDILVTVGGLGRFGVGGVKDCIFHGLDIPMQDNFSVSRRIEQFCKQLLLEYPTDELASLGRFPKECTIFPSDNGVDSGCAMAAGGAVSPGEKKQCVVMLPSAHSSFYTMAGRDMPEFLARIKGGFVQVRAVRSYGMELEDINAGLEFLGGNQNPVYCAYRDQFDIVLIVSAYGITDAAAQSRITPAVKALLEVLGPAAYGIDVDSMGQVVFTKLAQRGLRLSMAEWGTGGSLCALARQNQETAALIGNLSLSDTPDELEENLDIPPRFIKKQENAGSPGAKTAALMAVRAAAEGETPLGLSAVVRRPSESGKGFHVFAALADESHFWYLDRRLKTGYGREEASMIAGLEALNLLRAYLVAFPNGMDGALPRELAATGKFKVHHLPAADSDDAQPDDVSPAPSEEEETEDPPRRNTDIWRRIALLFFAMVFAGSAAFIGWHYYSAYANEKNNDELEKMYSSQSEDSSGDELPDGYPDGYQPRFAALYALNSDVMGWVEIPGTTLSYPVMQSDQDTSTTQYYLARDFYRKKNEHGVPFFDYRVDVEQPSENLVIYGHNMKDGQMFQELLSYADVDYYREHPVITLDTVYEQGQYAVIGAFIANTRSEHGEIFRYQDFIDSDGDGDAFLDYIYGVKIRSLFHTDVTAEPGDSLLTLSTCSYEFKDARFVVVAKRLRDGETVDADNAEKNPQPLYPDIWYTLYKGTKPDIPLTRPAEDTEEEDEGPLRPESPETDDEDAVEAIATEAPPETATETTTAETTTAPPETTTPETTAPETEETLEETPDTTAETTVPETSETTAETTAAPPETTTAEPEDTKEETDRPGVIVIPRDTEESSTSGQKLVIKTDRPDDDEDSDEVNVSRTSVSGSGRLSVTYNGAKESGDAFDILCQVVQAEMGTAPQEALKAQAVASYTYLMYENQRGVSPSVVLRNPSAATEKAVAEVLGETIYYGGSPIFACYHATSAGRTNSSEDVWGSAYPYLQSVDSSIDEEAPNFRTTAKLSSDEVAERVSRQLSIDLDGDPAGWFDVVDETEGGYNGLMSVGGETQYYYDSTGKYHDITGRVLREAVLGLRSAAFDIRYDEDSDEFRFTTYGYGHGVGMSQTGAILKAGEGYGYRDILKHYFTGVTIQ